LCAALVLALGGLRGPAWTKLQAEVGSWHILLGGLCVATQSVAIVFSITLTSEANVALIINTAPIFCALCDYFILREPTPRLADLVPDRQGTR